jgi:molecular chaperone DnaK
MSAPTPCRAVGIDLGTTFSVIAHLDPNGRPTTIPNAEGDLTTPSVVLFDAETIVVGKEALKGAVMEPERVALFVKRDMGCEVYSHPINGERLPPEVIQSLILEKIKRDGEAKLGPIRQVVITVPAYFNEPRRKATQDAGRLAGLDVLDIINEPTAAALTYGVQHGFLTASGESRQAETILVFDLGGGTFDVTLMRIDGREYRTLATAGDVYLGGIDWDRRIVDHVALAFQSAHHGLDPKDHPAGFQRLLREAEDAKRTLSAREQVTINFDHAGHGIRLALTRQQFEAMTADLLDRTRFTTTNLLREAGTRAADLTRLLLVGGSTRMPMVGAMLERELGIKPDRSLSVDEAVAHGAAIYAGLILSSEPSLQGMSVRNVNSHSLGVLGIESATGLKRTKVLIPRNSPIPASNTGRFKTRHEDQRSVSVKVVEGGDASGNGSTPIGRCNVVDLPPGLPAGTPVVVNFQYAENGRLTVEARIPTIDKQAVLTLDRDTGMSEEKLATWQDGLQRGSRPLGWSRDAGRTDS